MLREVGAFIESDLYRRLRQSVRVRFRRSNVIVRVLESEQIVSEHTVVTRDLSAASICFLHQEALHARATVEILLPRFSGGEDRVRGSIVYCRPVSGFYHAAGVSLAEPIEPRLYLGPELASSVVDVEPDLQPAHSRILLVGDRNSSHRLFTEAVRGAPVQVDCCASLPQSREQLLRGGIDLAVLDLGSLLAGASAVSAGTAHEFVKWLRQQGYRGRVAFCVDNSDDHSRRSVRHTDVVGVLTKPLTHEQIREAVFAWTAKGEPVPEALYSEIADRSELYPLLLAYMRQVHGFGYALAQHIRAGHVDACRVLCGKLRDTGTSFGFPELTVAAGRALHSIETSSASLQSLPALRRLQCLCLRLTSGTAPRSMAVLQVPLARPSAPRLTEWVGPKARAG